MKYLEEEAPLKCFHKCLFGLAMTLLLPYISFYFYVVEFVDVFFKALLHKCFPQFSSHCFGFILFFKDFVYLFLEEKGGREGENYQCVVASREALTGDLAPNPGMCPGWELNQ